MFDLIRFGHPWAGEEGVRRMTDVAVQVKQKQLVDLTVRNSWEALLNFRLSLIIATDAFLLRVDRYSREQLQP